MKSLSWPGFTGFFWVLACCATPLGADGFQPATRVAIVDGQWTINGQLTYSGTPCAGLLMNVRMVNATFEDRNDPDFDVAGNTAAFVKALPDYYAHGVRCITLCLQGGHVGHEGVLNSAFHPDGSLRKEYLKRVQAVIETCDRQGVIVILGCYYQRQDQVLQDEAAVIQGIKNVADWVTERRYANVMIEIANEYPIRGFNHTILQSPAGEAELIRLAKAAAPQLLVSSSGVGNGKLDDAVARASDFLLIHFNGTPVEDIPARIAALKKYGKPIMCNEDDKVGQTAVRALEASVKSGASWGYMNKEVNQYAPLRFAGVRDDPVMYAVLKKLTTVPGKPADIESAAYFPPPDIEGGWRTLTTARQVRQVVGMNTDQLDAAFEVARSSTRHGGLLVLRDGWLVYEKYFGLGHRLATPNSASCAKSITSIAMGILMAEYPDKFPEGLAQRVYNSDYLPAEAFPLSDPRKADIQLGQLLSMTAGIRGNNPCFVRGEPVDIDPSGPDGSSAMVDSVAFGLEDIQRSGQTLSARTLWCEPGGGYSYSTSSIHIVSAIVRHVAGMELEDYLRSRLAEPLGWGQWGYGYRTNRRLTHTPGGGGIALNAPDMLRFGYLLLNEGHWAGRQVVPGAYVQRCGSSSPFNPHFPYSLQFNVNTRKGISELPPDAYWKEGSGGYVLYVVPSERLVVWKIGGRDSQYSQADTGLPESSAAKEQIASRDNWQSSLSSDEAAIQTLRHVLDAIED